MPRFRPTLLKHHLNFFERLPGCFGIGKIGLDGRTYAENTEDDEELPGNVLEGWGDEQANCKVEQPIFLMC